MTQNALSPLARFGMGPDPYEWRSNMDAPRPNALAMEQLRQGPMPSGYDRVRDTIYNWLGGQPTNAWAANKLATAFDVGTMGLATGAYDGGQELAKGNGPGYLAAALMPGMRPVGAAVKAAAPVAREAAQGIRAYHGSPHDFDRFSLDKIGTGEGAQAYGHGLYFAENEGVAQGYRDTLSKFKTYPEEIARNAVQENNGDKARAIADLVQSRAEAIKLRDTEHVALIDRSIEALQQGRIAGPDYKKGRMYEVNIKANHDDFLDWDKPLSQQSEIAQKAVKSTLYGKPHETIAEISRAFENSQQSMGYGDAKEQMAQRLREAGIPGIKYLDQGSRAGGEGSRNLVVFDESLIEILRKYGLVPPAALGAAAATQDPAQASP